MSIATHSSPDPAVPGNTQYYGRTVRPANDMPDVLASRNDGRTIDQTMACWGSVVVAIGDITLGGLLCRACCLAFYSFFAHFPLKD